MCIVVVAHALLDSNIDGCSEAIPIACTRVDTDVISAEFSD